MKNQLFITFLMLLSFSLKSQTANDVVGARSTALGGYSSTLIDVWSVNNNQAALGEITSATGGVFYESRFSLKETSYRAGAFALPTKIGSFGLGVTSFGYSAFNESKIGLSYGQKLSEKLNLGVQMNYYDLRMGAEYGQKSTFTVAIGLLAKLTDQITFGAHIYNPNRSQLAEYDNEKIPTVMKMGMDYKFSDKVFLATEVEKNFDQDAVARVGLEYHAIDMLYLRGGIATNPTLSSFGFGMKLKDFKLDISSSFHQTLGLTPGISLVYTAAK